MRVRFASRARRSFWRQSAGVGDALVRGMKKVVGFACLSFLTLAACSTNLRVASAGHVGCSAEEIEINNTSYVDGAETWTAWCGGQVYYCARTRVQSSGLTFGRGGIGSAYGSTESTSCAPAASPPTAGEPATPERATADSDPPRGPAGFAFKSDRDAAAKRCADAGKEWRTIDDTRATCSGVAASVGFEATTELSFCSGELCGITLVARAEGDAPGQWLLQYGRIRKTLEDKYGQIHTSSAGHDVEGCTGPALRACMLDGRVRPATAWTWRSGETLSFALDKAREPEGTGFELRIEYRDRPRGRGDANAL